MRASALAVARGQSNRFADWDQPAAGRRGHLWATGHHWCAATLRRLQARESGVGATRPLPYRLSVRARKP